MFYTLREVGIIASAVFVGMTASTIMRMHAFTGHNNPYSHLFGSIAGVLGVVAGIDIYHWIKRRRLEKQIMMDGDSSCCQSNMKGQKHGK